MGEKEKTDKKKQSKERFRSVLKQIADAKWKTWKSSKEKHNED